MDIQGKTVLITGAARGIGAATARLFASQGANVVIDYLDEQEKAEKLEREITEDGGNARIIQGDIARDEDAKRLITRAREFFGSLDVLINNAGVLSWGPMDKEKLEELHLVVDVNLKGTINMIHAAIPVMKNQTEGIIINIASQAGKTGFANAAVYSATKFGIIGLTQALGQELRDANIRVYAVCPGAVDTDMIKGLGFQGMPPQKVAQRVLMTATEKLGLRSGQDTEIFS